MMTRVFKSTTDEAELRIGFGGNYYVVSTEKSPVEKVCRAIGKATSSVYFHSKHRVWTFRVRNDEQKILLGRYFNI